VGDLDSQSADLKEGPGLREGKKAESYNSKNQGTDDKVSNRGKENQRTTMYNFKSKFRVEYVLVTEGFALFIEDRCREPCT